MPNNNYYKNYDKGLIIGKNDKNSQIYDVLVFAPRNIVEITIPSFIQKIDSYSFSFSTIKIIKISSNVKTIGASAFSNCCYLEKIEFTENSELEIINHEAFFSSSLKHILIPSNVSFIGDHAFSQCKKLKKLLFSHDPKLNIIGNNAFSESSLESVFIPSSVNKIGNFAFASCKNLVIVEFGQNIEMLTANRFFDEYTFDDSPNVIILCPF